MRIPPTAMPRMRPTTALKLPSTMPRNMAISRGRQTRLFLMRALSMSMATTVATTMMTCAAVSAYWKLRMLSLAHATAPLLYPLLG